MKIKIVSSLLLCVVTAFLTGCVSTIDGSTKAGVPLSKDTIVKRVDRTPAQVSAAAREVLTRKGVLTHDHIVANTLEGTVNERTIWVKVESVEPKLTDVSVQARSKLGTDIELAADISTEIVIQLMKTK